LEVKIETDSNDAMEIKTEADSNDITECQHDDGPSFGMFALCLYFMNSLIVKPLDKYSEAFLVFFISFRHNVMVIC